MIDRYKFIFEDGEWIKAEDHDAEVLIMEAAIEKLMDAESAASKEVERLQAILSKIDSAHVAAAKMIVAAESKGTG